MLSCEEKPRERKSKREESSQQFKKELNAKAKSSDEERSSLKCIEQSKTNGVAKSNKGKDNAAKEKSRAVS